MDREDNPCLRMQTAVKKLDAALKAHLIFKHKALITSVIIFCVINGLDMNYHTCNNTDP
jgi:hypothetical protein